MNKSSSSSFAASRGNLRELFNFHCAIVILMDYDEQKTARFIRIGEFTVNLLVQAMQYDFLLMCVCVLGDLHWPLARDAPVIRIGLRTFVFAIPGMLYGLQFPPTCSTDVMDTLERVFLKFGHYEDLGESREGYPLKEDAPQFWPRIRSRIEPLAHSALAKLGHVPGRTPWTATDFKHSGLLRVLRVSSTTKIIGQAILFGTVKAVHIYIEKPKSETSTEREKGKTKHDNEEHQMIYASVNAFTDLVDVIEVAWMVASSTDQHCPKKKKSDHNEGLGIYWRWNKEGLAALIKGLKSAEEVEEKNSRDEHPVGMGDKGNFVKES